MNKENRVDQYQEIYLNQYGFESLMVKYRRKLVMERMLTVKPKVVVEVGCGSELLYQHYLQAVGEVERWVIVEPSSEFYVLAAASGLPNLVAIQGFFEETIQQVKEHLPMPPDIIIMSSMLHEVEFPVELLKTAKGIMDERSVLHVNVPNATSFHRLLAKSMGLISDVKSLSTRNTELMQHRVYDVISLRKDIETAGLVMVENGGYLVKSFTHAQMESISPYIGNDVLDGLYHLGKSLPDLASEIYMEARKA